MLYILYFLIISVLILIDQVTKHLIVLNFSLGSSTTVIENFFDITYIQNYGAGFSILQNETFFLSSISIIAIILLIYLLYKTNKNDKYSRISYLLIISGALANLLDRLRLTYVIDFLDFIIFGYDFPVFNFADCYITIGCFMIIFMIFKETKNAKY